MNIHPRAGSGRMSGTGVAIMTQVNRKALFKERCLEEALSIPQLNSMEGKGTVDFQSTTMAPNRVPKQSEQWMIPRVTWQAAHILPAFCASPLSNSLRYRA